MKKEYFIETIISADYDDDLIKNIILKGSKIGLIYLDHLTNHGYAELPILSFEAAHKKILYRLKNLPPEDHSLYIELIKDHFCHLWFYRSEENYMELRFSNFSYPKNKRFKDGKVKFDFGFYIDIALKLGQDWGIEKLIADYF